MNDQHNDLVATARKAGIWYLVLAISGILGFLVLHPQIYVSNDLPKTLTNLQEQETIARLRLLAEFVIIGSQALAAVYFFKLFKDINHFAAWSLAAWGTMNAGIIMISAIAMSGAIHVAYATLPETEKLIMIQIFVQLIKGSWGIGSLFFGLWLNPHGICCSQFKTDASVVRSYLGSRRVGVYSQRLFIVCRIYFFLDRDVNDTCYYRRILDDWLLVYLRYTTTRVVTCDSCSHGIALLHSLSIAIG